MSNLLIGRLGLGILIGGFILGNILLTYFYSKGTYSRERFKGKITSVHLQASLWTYLFVVVGTVTSLLGFEWLRKGTIEHFKSGSSLMRFSEVLSVVNFILGVLLLIIYACRGGALIG